MKKRLNFTGSESELLDYYDAYQKSIAERRRDSITIVADKLYVQKGFEINPKFKEMATQKLLTGIEMVNFTNVNETAKIINDFVLEKTEQKTGDIIKPESLNANTQIALMNTIYMKISFDKVFQSIQVDKNSRNTFSTFGDGTFTFYNDIEYVTFEDGLFRYADLKDLEAQAIEIRFADSDHSLVLILPDDLKNLSKLEAKMSFYDLSKMIDSMKPEKVCVQIPTFKTKYQTNLKNVANKVRVN